MVSDSAGPVCRHDRAIDSWLDSLDETSAIGLDQDLSRWPRQRDPRARLPLVVATGLSISYAQRTVHFEYVEPAWFELTIGNFA